MDQLTRIATALERIADALEKHVDPKLDWPSFAPARWPIPNPKDWQWTGPTADTRYGDMDSFHSGGIGGGLREGEIPAILSRGYDVDGKDVREWINSNDVKYPESDKKPE